MYPSYGDITERIEEEPRWWTNGIPRYCDFHPALVAEANEALLVQIRCQHCKRDFRVALGERRHIGGLSYTGLLNTKSQLGLIGDPPSHDCSGPGNSMTAEEVAVVEFWWRFSTPDKGFGDWVRRPELERNLEDSDAGLEERHLAAWSRIRRFRARPDGIMGRWTPATVHGPEFEPTGTTELPRKLPRPRIDRSPTTGKFIDTPRLNERRRLAMLALTGRLSEDEFTELKQRPQTEYRSYEERPLGLRPDWAEPLVAEVQSIDETVLTNAILGYPEMTLEQREERYCLDLGRQLFDLAQAGRITPEERHQVIADLIPHRYGG